MQELMKMFGQSTTAANKAAKAANNAVQPATQIAKTAATAAATEAAEAVGAKIRDEIILRYDPQTEDLKRSV